MSARLRLVLLGGCALVVALHAPVCLEALAGVDAGEPAPSAVASLDGEVTRP